MRPGLNYEHKLGPFRCWSVTDRGTTSHHFKWDLWRFQGHYTLHVHTYNPSVTNRIVFQTSHVYDCKRWGRDHG